MEGPLSKAEPRARHEPGRGAARPTPATRGPGSPVLEPPGVSAPVPAVVEVRAGVALAAQTRRLGALLRLVAAQHEVGVCKTGVHTGTCARPLTAATQPQASLGRRQEMPHGREEQSTDTCATWVSRERAGHAWSARVADMEGTIRSYLKEASRTGKPVAEFGRGFFGETRVLEPDEGEGCPTLSRLETSEMHF